MEISGTIKKTWFEPTADATLKLTIELKNKTLVELIDRGTFDELMNKYQLKVDGMDYIDLGIDGKKCMLIYEDNSYRFLSYIND